MTPEEKSLLERVAKLSEENNQILHSMRRSAKWANGMRWAYWAVIIALSFGAYYLIQPYMNSLISALGGAGGGQASTISIDPKQLQDLLKSL